MYMAFEQWLRNRFVILKKKYDIDRESLTAQAPSYGHPGSTRAGGQGGRRSDSRRLIGRSPGISNLDSGLFGNPCRIRELRGPHHGRDQHSCLSEVDSGVASTRDGGHLVLVAYASQQRRCNTACWGREKHEDGAIWHGSHDSSAQVDHAPNR